jgi:hypothetical protein
MPCCPAATAPGYVAWTTSAATCTTHRPAVHDAKHAKLGLSVLNSMESWNLDHSHSACHCSGTVEACFPLCVVLCVPLHHSPPRPSIMHVQGLCDAYAQVPLVLTRVICCASIMSPAASPTHLALAHAALTEGVEEACKGPPSPRALHQLIPQSFDALVIPRVLGLPWCSTAYDPADDYCSWMQFKCRIASNMCWQLPSGAINAVSNHWECYSRAVLSLTGTYHAACTLTRVGWAVVT